VLFGGVVFHATGFGQHNHQWINFEIFRQYPYRVKKVIKLFYSSANKKVVALKEIRLQEEEGAPFTAIREG